jgi:AraC-like DNA-binding protein
MLARSDLALGDIAMIATSMHSSIRALSSDALISSRVAATENVRVEFLRCKTQATLQWSVARPEVSLMWVRDKSSNARITMAGRAAESISPGRANCWFFPEGIGAEGELTGTTANDCVGVFVEPSFIPPAVKEALAEPIMGFSHNALGRAFNELAGELTEPDEVLPLFTEGWAMQALAYVARAARKPLYRRSESCSGLAPWQLRRATEMLRSDLSENLSLTAVASACKLSVSHFSRAFKRSTGLPPHQWIMSARIDAARDLLAHSQTPLVTVAGMCGFADQSHFSRIFWRVVGASPGAWRREQMA